MAMAIVLTGPVISGTIERPRGVCWPRIAPTLRYVTRPSMLRVVIPLFPVSRGAGLLLPVYAHVTHDRPLVAFLVLRIRTCSLENKTHLNEPNFSVIFPHGCGLRISDPGGLALWPPERRYILLFPEGGHV